VSSLEQITVGPSHKEVTMETQGSRICVGKGKFVIREGASLKEKLEENRKESNRVRLWANTGIIIADCRVSHMAFMVRSIKVDTIPARGEVNLGSHYAAVAGRKPGALFRGNTNTFFIISQANHVNGSLGRIAVVLSASVRVASNHPESIWKSHWYFGGFGSRVVAVFKARSVVTSSKLIVYCVVTEGDNLPHIVWSLVVQLRNPVVAVIECLVAGGLIG